MRAALSPRSTIALQLAGVGGALAALTLVPPAEGAMLLVPLGGGGALRAAVAAGAVLVGAGPWAGSVVVRGRRAALAEPLARAGVLMVAAPPGGCGAGRPGDRA